MQGCSLWIHDLYKRTVNERNESSVDCVRKIWLRYILGLWLRLECSLDCIIYVSEGFDVPRDYRSRRGRETIKRYDVTETYSHVVRQNLSETSITCAESC